jgi:hypothetical protein
MQMVVVVGVVVWREELAKQTRRAQPARQPIEERCAGAAAVPEAAREVAFDREGSVRRRDLVHVEGESVSMQAEAALAAGAIDVGAGEAHTRDAELGERRRNVPQPEREATVDDHRPRGRPELDTADRAPDHDRCLDPARTLDRAKRNLVRTQALEAHLAAG